MRIVFLNPVGVLGGGERGLLTAMAEVRRAAPAADLTLITAADGPLLDRTRSLGIAAEVLPLDAQLAGLGDSGASRARLWLMLRRGLRATGIGWDYVARLRRRLEQLDADLIHSNGIKMHLLAALAHPRGTPVVWHVQDFFGLRPVTPLLLKAVRRGVRGAIAISQAVARDLQRLMPGLPTEVILHAIDTAAFAPGVGDDHLLDRLAGLPEAEPGTIRIGLVATYAHWKGHEVFLQAAAAMCSNPDPRLPPLRFYIIGGPVYQTRGQHTEEELRRRVAELRLTDRVGFVPFQQETVPIYRALDVVVHASTQPEPFGLTIAEAMSCGRALVVARAGGAAELFRHGHDALGVPPGDVVALRGALQQLAGDPDLRARLGRNARETALRSFHADRIGPQVLYFYQRILRRREKMVV